MAAAPDALKTLFQSVYTTIGYIELAWSSEKSPSMGSQAANATLPELQAFADHVVQDAVKLVLLVGKPPVNVEHIKPLVEQFQAKTMAFANHSYIYCSRCPSAISKELHAIVLKLIHGVVSFVGTVIEYPDAAEEPCRTAIGMMMEAQKELGTAPQNMMQMLDRDLRKHNSVAEDSLKELQDAAAANEKIMKADDPEQAVQEAMEQGIPVWGDGEDELLAPALALIKICVNTLSRCVSAVSSMDKARAEELDDTITQASLSLYKCVDKFVISLYDPDEFESMRKHSTNLVHACRKMMTTLIESVHEPSEMEDLLSKLTVDDDVTPPPPSDWIRFLSLALKHNHTKFLSAVKALEDEEA